MTTITLEVTEEQAQQLAEAAQRLHIGLGELAFRGAMQLVEVSPEFVETTRQMIEEDRELLERLA